MMPKDQKPSANMMVLTEVLFVAMMVWLLYEYGDVWGKTIVGLALVCILILMLVVFHPELAKMLVRALANLLRAMANKFDDDEKAPPSTPTPPAGA